MGQEKQIWEVAAKPRRTFDSPEHMWQFALKYFKWCDDNPLYRAEQIKKPIGQITIVAGVAVHPETMVDIPLKRAYTKSGFCLFAGVAQNYLRNMRSKDTQQGYTTDENREWMEVLNRIDDAIFTQQYEGGASGQLNANIVSRGIGLVDKTESETKIVEVKEVFRIGGQEFEL